MQKSWKDSKKCKGTMNLNGTFIWILFLYQPSGPGLFYLVKLMFFAMDGYHYDCGIASTDVKAVCRHLLLHTIIVIKSCYNVGILGITSVFNLAFLACQAFVPGNRVGV